VIHYKLERWTNEQQLPNDDFSIDNAIIMNNSKRWPSHDRSHRSKPIIGSKTKRNRKDKETESKEFKDTQKRISHHETDQYCRNKENKLYGAIEAWPGLYCYSRI
jgi:hypothetical protein